MEVPSQFFLPRKHELIRYVECMTKDNMWFITFIKGKKQLTIQFKKPEHKASLLDTLEEIVGPILTYLVSKSRLTSVKQNHSHELDWEMHAPNWVYMNRRNDKLKSLRFMQKERKKDMSDVKEQPFARMIPEIDIDYDEVGGLGFWFGRWRGREVDVYRVTMDQDFGFLNRAMKAYRRIQGMNLSYDMLGHVLDEDGNIVGIMTEAMQGNRVTYRDYGIVMEAFEKLIKIGYILDSPHLGSMLITDKREVRIVEMHNVIELVKDPKARKRKVEDRREMLEEWFEDMRQWDPDSCLPISRGKVIFPVRILVPHSDPDRLLKGTSGWMSIMAQIYSIDMKPRLKLVRSGGIKRLLDEDSSAEEVESGDDDCDGRNRQCKRLRVTTKHPDPIWSERPLPRLPVARLDLPVLPSSPFDGSSTAYSKSPTPPFGAGLPSEGSLTVCSRSPSPSCDAEIPSWIREGPWLALARNLKAPTTHGFEEVE